MGSWSFLELVKKNKKSSEFFKVGTIDEWKGLLENDRILNLLFQKDDFLKESFEEDGVVHDEYFFRAPVKLVIKRLQEIRLTSEKILKDISEYAQLSKEEVKLALMLEFDYDPHPIYQHLDIKNEIQLYKNDDPMEDDTEEYEKYKFHRGILHDLEIYDWIRLYGYIKVLEEQNKSGYFLQINFSDFNYLADDLRSVIHNNGEIHRELNKNYLSMAKKHFIDGDYDLVYVELTIILESIVKRYLYSKKLSEGFKTNNLDDFFKGVSLMSLLQFSMFYLNDIRLSDEELQTITNLYNCRNNVIHQSQKKFNPQECAKSIEVVEKVLSLFKDLN